MDFTLDRVIIRVSTTLTGIYAPEAEIDPKSGTTFFLPMLHTTSIYDDFTDSMCSSSTCIHQVNVLASYSEEDDKDAEEADLFDIGSVSALLVDPAQVDYDADTVSEELGQMLDVNDPDDQRLVSRLTTSKKPFLLVTDVDMDVMLDTKAQLLTLFVEMVCAADKFVARNFGNTIDMHLCSNALQNFGHVGDIIMH